MMHGKHIFGFALLVAFATAPGALAAQTPFTHVEGDRVEEESGTETRVEVRNQNYLDVNVYVWRGSQRMRLGTVSGLSTRALTIPSHLLFGISSLRFELDPVGSRGRPVTNEVSVVKGDGVILTVPPLGL